MSDREQELIAEVLVRDGELEACEETIAALRKRCKRLETLVETGVRLLLSPLPNPDYAAWEMREVGAALQRDLAAIRGEASP